MGGRSGGCDEGVYIMKKSILILAAGLLALGIGLAKGGALQAASPINANEQRVLDAVSATGYTLGGATVILGADEINEARNFFLRDDIELTAADADVLVKGIEDIGAVMKGQGVTTFTALTLAGKQQILALAQAAVGGVTSKALSFTYNSATKVASILDKGTGAVLASSTVSASSTVIKQTGFGLQGTFLVAGGGLVAVLGAMALTKKYRLFERS